MRYDVFISCKSEDYESAKLIYKFLCEQSYRVFLADTELRKKGNAEYGKVIDEALDSAEHLILFTSRSEYVTSSYVESEWRIFIEEKRAGRKQGNLISILDRIDVSLLPISLRHFQSFPLEQYKEIVDYLPRKSNNGDLDALSDSLSKILSVEKLVENIYTEFKEKYSDRRSSEVINHIQSTIGEVIADINDGGRELKRSDFLKTIRKCINDKVLQSDVDTHCLALEIITKNCTAASEKVGGIIFSSYFTHNDSKIKDDLLNIPYNYCLLGTSMVDDSLLSIFKNSIKQSDMDKVLVSSGILAAIFAMGPVAIVTFVTKKILEYLRADDDVMPLSEIKEIHKNYKNNPDVFRKLKQTFENIIDNNNAIKNKFTEIVRAFCDDCAEKLARIGITSLSL